MGMTLHRTTFSSVSKVMIDGAGDRKYNTQSNRCGLRPSVSGLSGCRGGRPHSPRADLSRLTGRDDVVADVALDLAWLGRTDGLNIYPLK
ncbi:hypothetical protein B296_00023056 [Ensete ventricosum]|uniref:Uncharacterized protein n=1 Tax=Ensete ventricosum TaxID=4639 RepID=A0A427A1F3_ENSVE|nr:hypothetical protein B296_00023056 [Ensete ventricosum]